METGKIVSDHESKAVADLLESHSLSPMSRLLKHLTAGSQIVNVVTSNYDRLLEIQAELADIGVDTGYPGGFAACYSPKTSARAHVSLVWDGRKYVKSPEHHIRIHKPHGSLDWIRTGSGIRKCLNQTSGPWAIIAPGPSKYRDGYKEQFAQQLERARVALRAAQRYVVIGYGFNDDQLEQSWCPDHVCTKPLLIFTQKLSTNARRALAGSTQAIALTKNDDPADTGTIVSRSDEPCSYITSDIWSLAGFVKEII